MEKRILGNTGESLSVIGFGAIVCTGEEQALSNVLVAEAIDRGITYFDLGPAYGDAEERVGPALEPYRDGVFLACKTAKRTAQESREELEQSLRRLRTDRFDLYQLHCMSSLEDVDTVLGPGGAMETLVRAKDEGKARHLGFSAHTEEAALALMEAFPFDSVLFPVNWSCWEKGGFGHRIMKMAQEKEIGRLALKTLAERPWRKDEEKTWPKSWYKPIEKVGLARQALAFTLCQPITAAVCPGHPDLFHLMLDAYESLETAFPPPSPATGEPLFSS